MRLGRFLPRTLTAAAIISLSACTNQEDVNGWVAEEGFAKDAQLAQVAKTGAYADLSGAPDLTPYAKSEALAQVALSGDYADLANKPTLADVATSGSYADLDDTPDLARVATSGNYSDLAGLPELSPVASSGNYEDLSGRPELSTVAQSGAYGDLTGAPWTANATTVATTLNVRVQGSVEIGGNAIATNAAGTLTLAGPQTEASPDVSVVGDCTNIWREIPFQQSFKVTRTGKLTRIDVRSGSYLGTNAKLSIFAGAAATGTPLVADVAYASGAFENGAVASTFVLSEALEVEAGQILSWQVSGHDASGICNAPYADGSNGVYNSWQFVTFVKGSVPSLFVRGDRVGVGVASPEYALHVNGQVAGTGPYRELSDGRLKKDVRPLDAGLSRVMSLRPVSYDWRRSENPQMALPETRSIGFVAQELEQVVPEAVSADARGLRTVAYGELVPVLAKAVQEQQALIEAQRVELEQLRAKVDALSK